MFWNKTIETMPRRELLGLQAGELKQIVNYVYQRVPFYHKAMDQSGLEPRHIRTLEDLTRLPLTVKSDLRDNYPYGLFAVPMKEIIRTHASSGTTGKPTVVGYTRQDINTWAEVCARSLYMSGARPGDIFQNAYGYGLFTGGLGMHYGAELLKLNTIPVSGGNTARQILILQDFGTTIMACTPSYALALADAVHDAGIDPGQLRVRSFVLGAEPWTEQMRIEIETRLQADAVNIYGLSEIIGPGVSNECLEAKDGMHIMEDHFLPEIIDPDSGESLPEGAVGELVFTTLTKRAMPLLRYRTGDICSLNSEPCICGRTHIRMSRIIGRTDDMLIIRGVNVFPTQIEAAMLPLENITPHYRLIVSRSDRLDELEIEAEVSEKFYASVGSERFDDSEAVANLAGQISALLKEALGLTTVVSLVKPGDGPRSEGGKINRVIDKR